MPAYVTRWYMGPYRTTLLEQLIWLSVAVFVFELWRAHRQLVWRSPFFLPAVLFIVAGGIAVVTAPEIKPAVGLYKAYILEPIAFGLVLTNVMVDARRAAFLIFWLAVGGTAVGLLNSAMVLWDLIFHTYQVTQTPPVLIYFTANAIPLYLVPILALAISYALYGSTATQRWTGALFLGIGIVIVAFSLSRGGYLALAAVVIGAVLPHRRRLLLFGAAMAGLVAGALIPPIRDRVLIETQNVNGNTIQVRLDLWTASIKLIEHRPILGAGLSGFQARAGPYFTHLHTPANFIDAHNIVLNFWTETGLLGLIAVAWIMATGFWVSWRGWQSGPPAWRPVHLGVLLALLAVIVHGMVDVPYFKNDLSLEFWVLIALTWSGVQWSNRTEPRRVRPLFMPP